MKRSSKSGVLFGALLCLVSVTQARLPEPTEAQKAQAAAVKAKAEAEAEIEKAKLSKAQDRVVERYTQQQRAKGITVAAPTPTGATQEVPSAALNTRPKEKAEAYNESVTPKAAGESAVKGGPPDTAKPGKN